MQTIQMLRQLTQVDGVAGGEDRALAVAQEICENLGECSRTIQKSLVCQVMPPQEGRPHLLLDAHIDEIGLTVTHIEDNGFLRVGQAGGVDRRLLMASQVVVHTAQGDLPGVVGSVPPHIQSGEKKNPTVDEIWIDVGMDGQQAKEKIDLGSKISFVGPFTEMAGGLVSSKAFDDRCCCVAIIKGADRFDRSAQCAGRNRRSGRQNRSLRPASDPGNRGGCHLWHHTGDCRQARSIGWQGSCHWNGRHPQP